MLKSSEIDFPHSHTQMAIVQIIAPVAKDLGEFTVRRSLPYPGRQMVGPFIFFDHLGPAVFPPDRGVDVRPHPHIGLATVTYLFAGRLLHRDSLGTVQEIQPGAVNWMIAGRGIAHSERSVDADRSHDSTLHGIQTWLALPIADEEIEPEFYHYPAEAIPCWQSEGASVRLIAGTFQGHTSPVRVLSPTLYLDVELAPTARFTVPNDYAERAVYTVTAGLTLNDEPVEQHRLVILESGAEVKIAAPNAAGRAMIIGGEPLGQRWKWWNFVSSSRDRIEQAQADWRDRRFASVPDETEFIPLPASVTEANPVD